MRKVDRSEKSSGESLKENVSVYFKCPSGLLQQFEEIAKGAGFMSKDEAIRQAMREFLENYTPDHYKASLVTQSQIATMAQLWETYPNMKSMVEAIRAQSAGLPP